MHRVTTAILLAFVLGIAPQAGAQSLRGSPTSLARQNLQAARHDYTYLERPADVQRFVALGLIVPVQRGPSLDLARVSFPYARPEVKLFLERLSPQYKDACGEDLVVTSLVRPTTRQPRNAADESVHPTGMAVDLRRSGRASCRRWLERVLLQLEGRGVLEATRERRPPHYHVALFPKPYLRYVAALTGEDPARLLAAVNGGPEAGAPADAPAKAGAAGVAVDALAAGGAEGGGDAMDGPNAEGGGDGVVLYRVQRGDSLWSIARRFGTTVARIKEENGLTSSTLLPDQVLRISSGG